MNNYRRQKTLAQELSFEGLGIHYGKKVSLRLLPAAPGTGRVLRREDLSCEFPADLSSLIDANSRSTHLGVSHKGSLVKVCTVEHLLAALYACEVDNVYIQLNAPELPILDGSSFPFIKAIEEGGLVEQEEACLYKTLSSPVFFSEGNISVVAVPSSTYELNYVLDYPGAEALGTQSYSCSFSKQTFIEELAPSRTFALYEDLKTLRSLGLIQGGSLENAVLVHNRCVFSQEGLRFPNEMIRHKLLDLVGDLALLGFPFSARILAHGSGHRANVGLAQLMNKQMKEVPLCPQP